MWDQIPEDLDFLVTHMPPHQILDRYLTKNLGCPYLRDTVLDRFKPRVHMFGHVHESRGKKNIDGVQFINAANALWPNRPPVVFDYDVSSRRVLNIFNA